LVARQCAILRQTLQDLGLALGAELAGIAFPAGFLSKKPDQAEQDIPQVPALVEDHDDP
jgi:hypothetical protein